MSNITKTAQLEKSLGVSSLADLVRVKTSEVKYLLLDASGSMLDTMLDEQGRTTRMCDQMRRVVAGIQAQQATPMIAFGLLGTKPEDPNDPYSFRSRQILADFVNESPEPNINASTPLAEAIEFARENGGGHLIVISDGEPNWPHSDSIDAAKRFGGRIDVVFVGMPGSPGSIFLKELAEATGGVQFEGDLGDTKALTGNVIGLLNGEVPEIVDDEEDDEDDEEDDDDEDEEDDENN